MVCGDLTLGEMTFGEATFCKLPFGETTFGELKFGGPTRPRAEFALIPVYCSPVIFGKNHLLKPHEDFLSVPKIEEPPKPLPL
jgi:hypothetical protein